MRTILEDAAGRKFVEHDNGMVAFVSVDETEGDHLSSTEAIGSVLSYVNRYGTQYSVWGDICQAVLDYYGEEMVAVVALEDL